MGAAGDDWPQHRMSAVEYCREYEQFRAELVDGYLERMPLTGMLHGVVCGRAGCIIYDHVREHGLGAVAICDTWIWTRRDPDTVRGGDVNFYANDRLPKDDRPLDAGPDPEIPNLVVEVRPPDYGWNKMLRKVAEYVDVGVGLVVVFDIATDTAVVFTPNDAPRLVIGQENIDFAPVLPGLVVPLAKFFE